MWKHPAGSALSETVALLCAISPLSSHSRPCLLTGLTCLHWFLSALQLQAFLSAWRRQPMQQARRRCVGRLQRIGIPSLRTSLHVVLCAVHSTVGHHDGRSWCARQDHQDPALVEGCAMSLVAVGVVASHTCSSQPTPPLHTAFKVKYDMVDGCDPELKATRNSLFEVSGLRGKYPQVCMASFASLKRCRQAAVPPHVRFFSKKATRPPLWGTLTPSTSLWRATKTWAPLTRPSRAWRRMSEGMHCVMSPAAEPASLPCCTHSVTEQRAEH